MVSQPPLPDQRFPKETISRAVPPIDGKKFASFYKETLARTANVTHYVAELNARLLFGTDTPSSPLYTNPPGPQWLAGNQPARRGGSDA